MDRESPGDPGEPGGGEPSGLRGPRDEDRLYREAEGALMAGRPAEAVPGYRELLRLDPRHIEGRVGLARALDALDEPERAADVLSEGIALAPEQTELLVQRGALLGRMRRFPDGEADLRRVLKLHPAHAPAQFELGLLLWRKGLAFEAAELFQRSLALQPDRPAAYFYLGDSLNRTGDFAGAVAALDRALQMDPSDRRAAHLMGRVLDRMGRPEEAHAMYRRAQGATE
jgi:tetratricopeptide (TPR) repeat protein